MNWKSLGLATLASGIGLFAGELGDVSKLPEAAANYDFKKDVQAVLETRCVRCHNLEKMEGELLLDSLSNAMNGGDEFFGQAIVPGKSSESAIIHLSAHNVPELEMPPKDAGKPLTKDQIAKLRAWIDAGAPWPDGLQLSARKEKAEKPEGEPGK